MKKDYYQILGIANNASDEEVKKAYRRLAQQHHPDKPGGSTDKFKEINEAYQILSDRQKREQYDRYGTTFEQAGPTGAGGFGDFSDIFDMFGRRGEGGGSGWEDVFGGIFDGADLGGQKKKKRGEDIYVDLNISLEEAAGGVDKEIEVYKRAVCSRCQGNGVEPGHKLEQCGACQGRGRVQDQRRVGFFAFSQVRECEKCHGRGQKPTKDCSRCGGDGRVRETRKIKIGIPIGIDDGEVLRLVGEGEAGRLGSAAGDLYVVVHVSSHSKFKRRGIDLFYQQSISFTQAALGDKIRVPTLGEEVILKIPAGLESGTVLRLHGKGIKRQQSRGDLLVEIKIKTPQKVSAKAKKLLEELEKEL